jgi:hypothetical protein
MASNDPKGPSKIEDAVVAQQGGRVDDAVPDLVDLAKLSVWRAYLSGDGDRLRDWKQSRLLTLYTKHFKAGEPVNIANEEERVAARRKIRLGKLWVIVEPDQERFPIGSGFVKLSCRILRTEPVAPPKREPKTGDSVATATQPSHKKANLGTKVPKSGQKNNEAVNDEHPEGMGTKVPGFNLAASEDIIRANWGKLAVVGREFARIRASGVVKNWSKWCRENWNKSKRAIDYLISQSEVWERLKLAEDFPITRLRPLIGLSPWQQTQAWQQANQYAMKSDGQPTATSIKMAATKVTGKPTKNPPPEWSLSQAKRIFGAGVVAAANKAVIGATREQAKAFHEELPALMDHANQLLCDGTSWKKKEPRGTSGSSTSQRNHHGR